MELSITEVRIIYAFSTAPRTAALFGRPTAGGEGG